MTKYLCLLLALCFGTCKAQDNYVSTSVNWLKSSLPETMKLDFNKSRIKFNGCKHREYELNLVQPVTEDFAIEGGVSYAKGQLNWGVNKQQISVKRVNLTPRYNLSELVSISAGVVLQSSPEFKTSQGVELILPKSKIFTLTTRILDVRKDNQVEVALSRHRWQPTGEFGSLFANGLVDNKIGISYSALF